MLPNFVLAMVFKMALRAVVVMVECGFLGRNFNEGKALSAEMCVATSLVCKKSCWYKTFVLVKV